MGTTKEAQAAARRLNAQGVKHCPRCAQVKDLAAFASRRSAWDGLALHCRVCQSEMSAVYRARYRAAQEASESTSAPLSKRCPSCVVERPRSEFSPSRTTPDGRKGHCKRCCAARESERHASRRAYWTTADPYSDGTSKRCGGCRQMRPRTDFSTNPSAVDGLKSSCKSCSAASQASREARKRNQWVENVDRDVLWARDQGICYLCDLPADPKRWDLEHVHPIVHGGEHSYANTAVSHPSCNYSKGGTPWPDVSFDPAL